MYPLIPQQMHGRSLTALRKLPNLTQPELFCSTLYMKLILPQSQQCNQKQNIKDSKCTHSSHTSKLFKPEFFFSLQYLFVENIQLQTSDLPKHMVAKHRCDHCLIFFCFENIFPFLSPLTLIVCKFGPTTVYTHYANYREEKIVSYEIQMQ